MKRFREFVLCGSLLCLAAGLMLPTAAVAMDADELIAKHLEAIGGEENIRAIETMTATGKFMTQGMEIPFTMQQRRPNLMRIDATVMGMNMVQCFDGEKGWSIIPMTGSTDPQPMNEVEEKSFKLQADMDGQLVDWKEKGFTVEYIGEEDVEGTPAYRLKLDTGQDVVYDYFFDKDYFLVIKQAAKITHEGNVIETASFPSDYQEVDGMIMSFSVETRMGDQVMNQIMMDKIEHGVPVDAELFLMPEKAEAPPAEPEE